MRVRLVVLSLVGALLVLSPAGPASAAAPGRAMWLWTRPDPATFVAFATAHDVSDVFVSVPPDLAHDPDLGYYRDLRAATRQAGITLRALGSETTYVDRPDVALAWQRSALSTGLFDGVHLDVEPWIHPDWRTDRAPLLDRYLHLLGVLAGDTSLPVEADVAFWLGSVRVHGHRLDREVAARVDGLTVMTYRNHVDGPDGVLRLGRSALATGERAGIPVRLAVETNFLGSGAIARKQTFWGRRAGHLAAALDAVDAGAPPGTTYRGVAVHDYDGWRALAP